jgi:multiple antibiotic resistance protein
MIAAVEMVIAQHTGMTSTTAPEEREANISRDITVFPLAIPLISGPGALATVVLVMQEGEESYLHQLIIVGIVLVVMGITFLSLRAATFIQKILGVTGSNVITRVFGIILTALATQFIITGIKRAFF